MTYPFVQAKWYTPNAILQYRAVILHHAEGGGTVSHLTDPKRKTSSGAFVSIDVSASHVIEYSGRIVQMVKDGDASHCQHTSPEPYKAADFGIYSSATGRTVLLEGWSNVNRYVFAVEMEGFRAKGPNPAQVVALKALVADLRARFPSIRGLLGHRDIQDKPCPGGLIPWAQIGGHGLFAEEDEVIKAYKGEDWKPTIGATGQSNGVYRATPDRSAPIVARLPAGTIIRTLAEVSANGENWRSTKVNGAPVYFLRADLVPLVQGGDPATDAALTAYIARTTAPLPDCSAAVQAEYDRVVAGVTFPARP